MHQKNVYLIIRRYEAPPQRNTPTLVYSYYMATGTPGVYNKRRRK